MRPDVISVAETNCAVQGLLQHRTEKVAAQRILIAGPVCIL